VPQYKYREYTISISTMRVDDAIKVDTDIFLSPDAATGVGNRLRAGTTKFVSVAPLDEVHKTAFDSAAATIDEHIAAQSALPKARR
jgi:hypothetical protein